MRDNVPRLSIFEAQTGKRSAMGNSINPVTRQISDGKHQRGGSILALAAGVLVLAFAFAAFTLDIRMIGPTNSQLLDAADAAATATVMELLDSKRICGGAWEDNVFLDARQEVNNYAREHPVCSFTGPERPQQSRWRRYLRILGTARFLFLVDGLQNVNTVRVPERRDTTREVNCLCSSLPLSADIPPEWSRKPRPCFKATSAESEIRSHPRALCRLASTIRHGRTC